MRNSYREKEKLGFRTRGGGGVGHRQWRMWGGEIADSQRHFVLSMQLTYDRNGHRGLKKAGTTNCRKLISMFPPTKGLGIVAARLMKSGRLLEFSPGIRY